jgi:hypothetical protein
MLSYLSLPFILQSIVMFFDERIHTKRGLGIWERLGHPLDTLSVLMPFTLVLVKDYTRESLIAFIALSVFSCLFITKDEWVHSRECDELEQWMHSLLFMLHPLVFVCTGILWKEDPRNLLLLIQPVLTGLFLVYQILKWSFSWKEVPR